MEDKKSISAAFPFEPKFVEVNGQRIHYVDEGAGDPVLFIHGNPTSSYLWRNIIPYAAKDSRAIALDLIGMGKSDKPDIPYRFSDHVPFVEGFIEALGLRDVTLVIHDWGSALGFHYARRNADNVKSIVFMEGVVRPMRWTGFPRDFRMGFKLMRTPWLGWMMVSGLNIFVEKILPNAVVRKLTSEEMAVYRAPYRTIRSRRPVRVWPTEIPIEGTPSDVHEIVDAYSRWLGETDIPMLMFHASPGGTIREDEVTWCRKTIRNLEVVDIGQGIHFIQEDNPHLIGEHIERWISRLHNK